jgi:hypothetical protein
MLQRLDRDSDELHTAARWRALAVRAFGAVGCSCRPPISLRTQPIHREHARSATTLVWQSGSYVKAPGQQSRIKPLANYVNIAYLILATLLQRNRCPCMGREALTCAVQEEHVAELFR